MWNYKFMLMLNQKDLYGPRTHHPTSIRWPDSEDGLPRLLQTAPFSWGH